MATPTPIAIAVVERDDCFLIGQRPPGVPLAGLWEFPGGKIQPGETPEAAAVRECLEETGIAVEPLFRYPEHVHAYEHGLVHLLFIACKTADDPPPEPHAPFLWASRNQICKLSFPNGNAAVLRMIADSKSL
jgi:8-oxo-dGTP diphosphatase